LPVHDAGVAVEAGDPGLVAQHEHRRRSRLVVRRLHHAAVQGGHPEELERAGSDQVAVEPLRALTRGVEHVLAGTGDHGVEHVVLLRVVEKLGPGEDGTPAGLAPLRVVDLDRHQPLRVGVRKWLHQHVVDDAEERGGGRDAEREGEDGHPGKSPALGEGTNRVPKVLDDGGQRTFSARVVGTRSQQ